MLVLVAELSGLLDYLVAPAGLVCRTAVRDLTFGSQQSPGRRHGCGDRVYSVSVQKLLAPRMLLLHAPNEARISAPLFCLYPSAGEFVEVTGLLVYFLATRFAGLLMYVLAPG